MTTKLVGAGVKVRSIEGWLGGAAALMWIGCAAPITVARPTVTDMRGNARLTGREAQALVAGPIKLLHVNSDSGVEPRFSHVWQRDGATDCRNGTPLAWDGQSSVDIGADELVCVTADGPARLFWHGRSIVRDLPSSPQQASLR